MYNISRGFISYFNFWVQQKIFYFSDASLKFYQFTTTQKLLSRYTILFLYSVRKQNGATSLNGSAARIINLI